MAIEGLSSAAATPTHLPQTGEREIARTRGQSGGAFVQIAAFVTAVSFAVAVGVGLHLTLRDYGVHLGSWPI